MTKDLSRYNEILQEARNKNDEAVRAVCRLYIPRLYEELRKQGYEPYLARAKIMKDCKPMWAEASIHEEIPAEAKEASKAIGGYASAEVRKVKALTDIKHWILGNHVTYGKITEAFITSSDGNFRIGVNAKHDFVKAEPITPKSEAPEPLTVKSVSSAPVRSP